MRLLDELLKELGVDEAGAVTVGRLSATGVGASLRVAQDQANWRANNEAALVLAACGWRSLTMRRAC